MTIDQANALLGNNLGFSNQDGSAFDGSPGSIQALAPEQQIQLTNALKAYIATNPSLFSAAQVAIDSNPTFQKPISDIQDTSFSFSDFGNAIDDEANAFSANFKTTLLLTASVIILFYTAPIWLPQLKKALSS